MSLTSSYIPVCASYNDKITKKEFIQKMTKVWSENNMFLICEIKGEEKELLINSTEGQIDDVFLLQVITI